MNKCSNKLYNPLLTSCTIWLIQDYICTVLSRVYYMKLFLWLQLASDYTHSALITMTIRAGLSLILQAHWKFNSSILPWCFTWKGLLVAWKITMCSPLVSCEWLKEQLDSKNTNIRVLDGECTKICSNSYRCTGKVYLKVQTNWFTSQLATCSYSYRGLHVTSRIRRRGYESCI